MQAYRITHSCIELENNHDFGLILYLVCDRVSYLPLHEESS